MDMSSATNNEPAYPAQFVRKLYGRMLRMRRFTEQVRLLRNEGDLPGMGSLPPGLSIGQEAIIAGVCTALRPDDYLTPTAGEEPAFALAKGGDAKLVLAELAGKATGYCKGKSGAVQLADFAIGLLGAAGSSGLPVAVGAALSARYRGTDQVTAACFAAATASHASFHEALILATTYHLPVVFVCEHRQTTPANQPTPPDHQAVRVSGRAAAYGLPTAAVDGCDALAVYAATAEAVERARQGSGPTLLEATSNQAGDPLQRVLATIDLYGMASESQLSELDDAIAEDIEEAVEFARRSPDPRLEALYANTWI